MQISKERNEVEMGKKNSQPYVSENLESLAKDLVYIRGERRNGDYVLIDLEGLKKALSELPKEDREKIERFWGLKGGINHSIKLKKLDFRDKAFVKMSDEAIKSLRTLFRLDFLYMCDRNVAVMVNCLGEKLSRNGENISHLEATKYLLLFFIILQNGPKMSYESDPMELDTETSQDFTFDEYAVIRDIYEKLKDIPSQAINFKLIKDWVDMLDFEDALRLKKTFRIGNVEKEIPREWRNDEIVPVYTFSQVRSFKERVFQQGRWEIVEKIILGDPKETEGFEEFLKQIDKIRKDWSTIGMFKTRTKSLKVSNGIKTLDVYEIKGIEFTDIYEIMFLYLEREYIDIKIPTNVQEEKVP